MSRATINNIEGLLRDGGWFRRLVRMMMRRNDAVGLALFASPPRNLGEVIARTQLRLRILDSVMAIDEPVRTVVVLRVLERCSYSEIARLTDAPDELVRVYLRRGLEHIRETMSALA